MSESCVAIKPEDGSGDVWDTRLTEVKLYRRYGIKVTGKLHDCEIPKQHCVRHERLSQTFHILT